MDGSRGLFWVSGERRADAAVPLRMRGSQVPRAATKQCRKSSADFRAPDAFSGQCAPRIAFRREKFTSVCCPCGSSRPIVFVLDALTNSLQRSRLPPWTAWPISERCSSPCSLIPSGLTAPARSHSRANGRCGYCRSSSSPRSRPLPRRCGGGIAGRDRSSRTVR